MNKSLLNQVSDDCLVAAKAIPDLIDQLRGQSISVIGGYGFVGTWISEMVATLNSKYNTNIKLTLLGREPSKWAHEHPHLQNANITLNKVDVLSPFELPKGTKLVIHAAGIADIGMQASQPEKVYQTTIMGIMNSLSASKRLNNIEKFVNISSGLVVGRDNNIDQIRETDLGIFDFKKLNNLYAEMRRASEAIANAFTSQYRLPLVTARAYTFVGPYQKNNIPWAINRFISNAVEGKDIRIIGAGKSQRTYIYGSDVAAWILRMAVAGENMGIYNLGGNEPISHEKSAEMVCNICRNKSQIIRGKQNFNDHRRYDFIPNLESVKNTLDVKITVNLVSAISRTIMWEIQKQNNFNDFDNNKV
jgi:nucleoside-diphosphate-sugar epimerase